MTSAKIRLSGWTRHKNFHFLFQHVQNFDTVLTNSNPENFANIWQIKWNWIRSMKFVTVWIHFLGTFLVCCHPEILLPWQRDVTTSPLYWAFNLDVILRRLERTSVGGMGRLTLSHAGRNILVSDWPKLNSRRQTYAYVTGFPPGKDPGPNRWGDCSPLVRVLLNGGLLGFIWLKRLFMI